MRRVSGPLWRVAQRSAGALLALLCAASAQPARALTVTCIEASRYKYIYRIFDNDRARFAAFFGADEKRLPPPEACRAMLLTGSIDRAGRDGEASDFDRLREAIEAERGWLATLYLASPGGNVVMGLRLANLARMFWLNTHAVNGPSFTYVPDFLSAGGPGLPAGELPPDLQRGWENYLAATNGLTVVELAERNARRCVSACTYIHAAGIYRAGPAYFHRARRSTRAPPDGSRRPSDEASSMADMLEGLQKTEERIVAHFRKMDAGDAAITAYQSTATQTTLRAEVPPFPRYIDDYLKKLCSARPMRPREPRAADLRTPRGGEPAGGAPKGAAPKPAAPAANAAAASVDTRQCLASANSRERRKQFEKLCYDGCDRATLLRETGKRIRALLPGEQREEPQRRRGRER